MTLDPKFIEGRKEVLLKTKSELEAELKELDKMPDMGEDSDHFEEETDEAEEYVTNLSKADVLRGDLQRVNEALVAIEKGTYGICITCGKPIEEEILEIAPESHYCKACKLARPYRKTAE